MYFVHTTQVLVFIRGLHFAHTSISAKEIFLYYTLAKSVQLKMSNEPQYNFLSHLRFS